MFKELILKLILWGVLFYCLSSLPVRPRRSINLSICVGLCWTADLWIEPAAISSLLISSAVCCQNTADKQPMFINRCNCKYLPRQVSVKPALLFQIFFVKISDNSNNFKLWSFTKSPIFNIFPFFFF